MRRRFLFVSHEITNVGTNQGWEISNYTTLDKNYENAVNYLYKHLFCAFTCEKMVHLLHFNMKLLRHLTRPLSVYFPLRLTKLTVALTNCSLLNQNVYQIIGNATAYLSYWSLIDMQSILADLVGCKDLLSYLKVPSFNTNVILLLCIIWKSLS